MYLLYSLLFTIGFIALLPRFIFDAFRHGKYVAGFSERLGQLAPVDAKGAPVIWLHCVSVGETQAARPLVRALLQQFPSHALVVSTTTLTGQRLAREVFSSEAAAVFYFPFDWSWTVRRTLNKVNPAAVVIMETELWPRFLRECRLRSIPVALVNGRLSPRSARRYRLVRRFISRVVNDLTLALMQTEADARRIRSLGLRPERVKITGNVKFDAGTDAGEDALTAEFRERFHLKDGRPLIIAASTHSPEERIVIEAFKRLRASDTGSDARLLIVPRHPERFEEAASLLASSGLNWTRRSSAPSQHDASADAILLDSIGELRAVYPLASIVFVGGSIARTGGHNVLEPAAAGVCILTGAHTTNFAAIIREFLEADALVQLPPLPEADAPRALAEVFQELLRDGERRQTIARRARDVLERNRGATERTIKLLGEIFERQVGR
jgi:3-deoxy-D-manno-octulosonic-acid transferase